jgi:hypothetical protein
MQPLAMFQVDIPHANVARLRLIGIKAVQLAIALISNLLLLLNMSRRALFSVTQPIIIIGW